MTALEISQEIELDENAIRVNMSTMLKINMVFTARFTRGKSGHQVSVYSSRINPVFAPSSIIKQNWFSALEAK